MRFLSLFAGIEAASVAWEPLGAECVAIAEVEPFPCAVNMHHRPHVPNLGDVTKITEAQIKSLGHIDLIVFGAPCQDLSVAGKRKGMLNADGTPTRSGLFFKAIDIAKWSGARFWLYENVPGAFTSNQGADFAAVVGEMAGLRDVEVPKNGWGSEGAAVGDNGLLEWSVLDAQWFGLAQRRKRVFALVDTGNWADRPPILLEPQSLRRDTPPRREAGEAVAGTIDASLGRSRGAGTNSGALSHWDGDFPHPSLTQSHNTGGVGQSNQELFSQRGAYLVGDAATFDFQSSGQYGEAPVATTLSARDFKCAKDLVTHTLRGEGFDASEDGTGRGTPLVPVIASTLTENNGGGGFGSNPSETFLPVTYSIMPQNSGCDYKAREVEVAQPIMAGGLVGGNEGGDYILQPVAFHPTQDPISSTDGSTHALGCGSKGGQASVAVAIPINSMNAFRSPDADPSTGCGVGEAGEAMFTLTKGNHHAVAVSLRGREDGTGRGAYLAPGKWPADIAPTLNAAFGDKQGLEDQHIRGGQGSSFPQLSMCLNAGAMGRRDAETETLIPTIGCVFDDVAHTLKAEGFDVSEDGTGRGTPLVPVTYSIMPQNSGKDYKAREVEVAQPIMAGGPVGGNQGGDYILQPVAFAQNSRDEVRLQGGDGQIVGALAAEPRMKQTTYVAFHPTQDPISSTDGSTHALGCGSKGGQASVAVAVSLCGREGGATAELGDEVQNCLRASSGGGDKPHVLTSMQVRRLTPVECERLQGFPDGYTAIPWKKKPASECPDGPRYKALGNSMAVPVMRWIGARIAARVRGER